VLPSLLAYQAAVAAVAVLLVAALPHRSAQALADAVVDLADQPHGSLRARLAAAVADPSLELAVWSPTTRDFRTDAGRVVDPDGPGPGRDTLVVTREGQPLAALVHDPQALRDPDLVEAVSGAVLLFDTNAALRARVDALYQQMFDSRRRLVLAADEERRALAARLQDGPLRLLTGLEQALEGLTDAGATPGGGDPVQRAREHAREAVADLARLSNGLRPSDLDDGLAAAVERAAARIPAEVTVRVDVDPLPATLSLDAEVTAYFVVSEALANVIKYAHARQAVVTVSSGPDGLHVSVDDDGVGGAHATPGSGLQGLADRLAALGGTFEVRSPPGAGTRVEAALAWPGST
jgi:signal transduction histidine kinase